MTRNEMSRKPSRVSGRAIRSSYFTEEFGGEEGEVQDGESADGQLDEVADMGSESGEDGGMDKDGDGKEDDDTGVDDDMEGVDEQDVSGVNEEDGDEDEVIGQDGNEALKDRDGAAEEEGEDEVMVS